MNEKYYLFYSIYKYMFVFIFILLIFIFFKKYLFIFFSLLRELSNFFVFFVSEIYLVIFNIFKLINR